MVRISKFLSVISMCLATSIAPALAADDTVPESDAPVFDMGIELSGVTDYMDVGLTNSNHKPSFSLTLSPSYDIFYGEFYIANIDYGASQPKFEARWSVGATPEFGNLAVDFNLERKIKYKDPSQTRWVPYVTGTYTFNDNLSASLGAGYYAYDAPSVADFYEIYAASTYTFDNGAYLTGEVFWEPNADGANNAYHEIIGTLSVPFADKFEAIGKVGYEGYEDSTLASYTWYEAGLNYNFNENLVLGVGYHGSTLSGDPANADCGSQAYTDCESRVFAKLTLKTNWSDLFK
jgi:opacity protein-like surface antigen